MVLVTIMLEKDESFFYFQTFKGKDTIYDYKNNSEREKYVFGQQEIVMVTA